MKKTLSVFLAMLLIALTMAPAFAAGSSYSVTFSAPSSFLNRKDAAGNDAGDPFYFIKSTNGENAYVEVTDLARLKDANHVGELYVKYTDTTSVPAKVEYYVFNDILFDDDKKPYEDALAAYLADTSVPDASRDENSRRYEPEKYAFDTAVSFNKGDIVSFKVGTNCRYDVSTVVVTINGTIAAPNQYGEYTAVVDRNLSISVKEKDENGTALLLPNHYTVTLTSGDGYYVKTLKNTNNRVVSYGDSYQFRVKLVKGYSGNGMKVYALSGKNDMSEFIGEEFDTIRPMLEKLDPLPSTGVDEDGCRLYQIDKVTENTKIIVSGVQEESKVDILAMLKRILRAILHAFGIHLAFLDEGILAYYKVEVFNNADSGVTYSVSAAGNDGNGTTYNVLGGESVTVTLATTNENASYKVRWEVYEDSDFTKVKKSVNNYNAVWTRHYNSYTGEYTWTTDYHIDGIDGNVKVIIEKG